MIKDIFSPLQDVAFNGSFSQENDYHLSKKDKRAFLGITALSLLFYGFLFYWLRHQYFPYNLSDDPDVIDKLAKNIVTSLHALSIVPIAFLYLCKVISLATWRKAIGISLGYFLFVSLVLMIGNSLKDIILHGLHHFIILYILIFYVKRYPLLVAQGLLSELTAPFLYFSWFLIKSGHQQTVLFYIFAGLTIIAWACMRVVNFTYIYRRLYRRKAPLIEYIGFSPVLFMNYYWFFKLVEKAYLLAK